MKMDDYIRERIVELTQQRGISEYELSYQLGKNKNYIRKITTEGSLPSMPAFFDICDFFEIEPEEFFCKASKYPLKTREIIAILNEMDPEQLDMFLAFFKDYQTLHLDGKK